MPVRALVAALVLTATLGGASAAPPPRVVALAPSLVEDCFAVGAGAQVVGVSAFSDWPPAARRLPVVATSASIDAERIVALRPGVVLGIAAQDRLAGDLRRAGLTVRLVPDDRYADIFTDLRTVGEATGHAAAARALIARLRARTAALVRTVAPRRSRPSVFVVLGTAPIYTVGNGSYIAELIALAGGRNAAAIGSPYAQYGADALVARQPDALIVDPAIGFAAIANRPPWNALRAVREHRVYTMPSADLLERPGPRFDAGLAWLITTLKGIPT